MLVELTQNEVAALATLCNDKAAKEKHTFAKLYLEELGKKLEKQLPVLGEQQQLGYYDDLKEIFND